VANRAGLEGQLRRRGEWLAASCVPRWGNRGFLFAGRVDGDMLVLSGVGGKVESGETFAAAMVREFAEETGCRLKEVCRVNAPRHLAGAGRAETVPDGAAALIIRPEPAHPEGGTLWIAVFLAVLEEQPRPVEKVRLFPVVPPGSLNRPLGQFSIDDLQITTGHAPLPAREILGPDVTRVSAVDTAAAVLHAPRLLAQWWYQSGGCDAR
jgi:8-oxo-dGTP pyrophosphatase MutT (NUDIX family)